LRAEANEIPIAQNIGEMPVAETSKTVTNALAVMECFHRDATTLSSSEIARRIGIPRTNVLRLLATLQGRGWLERTDDGANYRVGLRAFEIGANYLAANSGAAALRSVLNDLVTTTGCTAYAGVLDGDDVVITHLIEGTLPIRFVWKIGDRLPCTTTAMGKAILSHLSDSEIDKHLRPGHLRTLTPKSIKSRKSLQAELEQARKTGWTFVREESHAGLTAVGCAVLAVGKPVSAVSVCWFDHPADRKRLERYAQSVVQAADRIAREMRARN
jgi:DNA-binding IclR family transcriptional regulator